MKKIIFAVLILIGLILAFVFLRHKGEKPAPTPAPPAVQQRPIPAASQHTLTYIAGENGTIEGMTPQTVKQGGDGSPITAIASEHYHFAGWSDGVTDATRTDRKVTKDLAVTAIFAIDRQTLTYEAGEGGIVSGPSHQKVDYGGAGTLVKAVPAKGYHFVGWSDGVKTPERTDAEVTGDLSVTAEFVLNRYTLTYTAGANGVVKGESSQTVSHGGDGSAVTAVPKEHYHFTAWSDGVSEATRTDRKVTADLAVTAQFAVDQYTLTYISSANGSITGVNKQSVVYGGKGSVITAVPNVGYHFVGWSDGVKTPERTESKVAANLAVTAIFAINRYTLIYQAGENGSISGEASQSVEYGGNGSAVTAVANRGYHFLAWSDGVTTAQRSDSDIHGDLKVSAQFEVNTYIVSGSVSGLIDGTQLVLQNNGGDNLTISQNGPFRFASELLNDKPYQVKVLTQPVSPNQICTIAGSSGTIPEADVTNIEVTCIPITYKVGGTVSGLAAGDRIVLQNNGGDDLVIGANGTFAFATSLNDGSAYKVRVFRQPKRPNLTCQAEKTSGVLKGGDVTDVAISCWPKPVLQIKAGKNKIKLIWNSQDFSKATFDLCFAREKIGNKGGKLCQSLKGGVLKTKATGPLVIALLHDIPYWFQVEASLANGRKTLSDEAMGMSFGGVNDSGIDWCSGENRDGRGTWSEKVNHCRQFAVNYPGQDGLYGRDAAARDRKLKKIGSGSSGFDFTKLCTNGTLAGEKKCPSNPSTGEGAYNLGCIRDNTTGLLWEIKTYSGLRSKNNTYTWFSSDMSTNGGNPGMKNGGACQGSECDTASYIEAVNDLKLCGVSDWRLPTRRELLSIVDNSETNPAIDTSSFPNTLSSHYWTSLPAADQKNSAWQLYFNFGESSVEEKSQTNRIRLVSGRTVTFGLDNP